MEAAFGEMIAKRQLEKLHCAFKRYKTLLVSASVVLFSCTGILIVPFVRLYTKSITDADYIQPLFALILLMAEAVNCMMLPCSSLPVAANQLKQTRWGAYGEVVINIVLSCIFIRWNPLIGVALGTLVATVFRGVFYMVYSARNILHIPCARLLAGFLGPVAAIGTITVTGCRLLQPVVIDNYFRWILWGTAIFAIICVPVATCCWKRLKGIKNETYSDCK